MKKLADNDNTLQMKIRSLQMKKLASKTARMRTGTLWITPCGSAADADTNLYCTSAQAPTPIRIFPLRDHSAVSSGACRQASNKQDKQTGSVTVRALISDLLLTWRNMQRTDQHLHECNAVNGMDFLVRLSIPYIHPDLF